ncbi:DoxX family protein [Streptomyces sp. Act143]|uniref:DoxX family protein n=1 Tax=Streptomyces sp. Act143 TaxID=2200760 RepID=UPI000D683277|nr:DoxX family protein [Streptomyces sp. Act143]PWI18669.1 DoxX family protein [Streptomyces sp. Act143]
MTGRLNSAQPYVLGLFRIVVGLLFTCHGAASLFGVLGSSSIPAGTWPGWYAAMIQLIGGPLVLLGLGTRAAAFLASGSMAYAYFKVHQPAALWPMENGGEASVMFCWAFLLLVFTGSGAFGVDRLFARRASAGAERPAAEKTPVTA